MQNQKGNLNPEWVYEMLLNQDQVDRWCDNGIAVVLKIIMSPYLLNMQVFMVKGYAWHLLNNTPNIW